jgi:hypothetical protein
VLLSNSSEFNNNLWFLSESLLLTDSWDIDSYILVSVDLFTSKISLLKIDVKMTNEEITEANK